MATLDYPANRLGRTAEAARQRRVLFWQAGGQAVLRLIILTGLVFMVLPGIWMVLSSFKTRAEITEVPLTILPHAWIWSNFAQAIEAMKFTRVLGNSVIITLSITAINIVTCTWGGYTFGKLRWPGRDRIFLLLLSTMMIPLFLTLIPRYVLVSRFHFLNSYAGMIVPFASSAFGIFLTKQFMVGIPNELLDAARVDGASALGVYWRIIVPLCKPIIAVLAIFIFQWNWDDLLWASLIMTKRDMWTIAVSIANLRVQAGDLVELQMAGSTLAVLPVLLVFVVLQRHIVRAVTISGLKG